jgi:hypothetical protein
MSPVRKLSCLAAVAAFGLVIAGRGQAQPQSVDLSLYSGLRWRMLGPFRGGRVNAVAGVPGQPATFYFGSVGGGGVWKTIDTGRTWTHIGLETTRQIGRVAVDPRNPDVVFVAALGHFYGPHPDRGVYRSTDGGKDVAEGALQER